tara:strand:- start:1047 stop:1295 length:249 start_codon:yes stop_codon:yes gene_type:complete
MLRYERKYLVFKSSWIGKHMKDNQFNDNASIKFLFGSEMLVLTSAKSNSAETMKTAANTSSSLLNRRDSDVKTATFLLEAIR